VTAVVTEAVLLISDPAGVLAGIPAREVLNSALTTDLVTLVLEVAAAPAVKVSKAVA
jgi:hypothetical protein